MSQQTDTGTISVVAGAARAQYLRVYSNSGTITTAGASNLALGVQQIASLASTDVVPIRRPSVFGSTKMVANGVIAIGGTVYAAASGKVASSGTIIEGIAAEAAATDGDVIEVYPTHNNDVSTASTGTTSATWQVDSDVGKPRAGLKSQTGGTGDYVAYFQAPATLTADRVFTAPGDASDTLAGLGTAQTFTAAQTFSARTVHSGDVANTAGVGITGTAASCVTSVEKVGTLIRTTILVDLQGLNSGGTADDIIGANGAGVAHLGQITAAVNGTIIAGRMTCLETPATGDNDIDLWYADEATGVEDSAISALTGETQITDGGDITAGTVRAITPPAANKYLYLVAHTGDADATYSAGILLIELFGKAA